MNLLLTFILLILGCGGMITAIGFGGFLLGEEFQRKRLLNYIQLLESHVDLPE